MPLSIGDYVWRGEFIAGRYFIERVLLTKDNYVDETRRSLSGDLELFYQYSYLAKFAWEGTRTTLSDEKIRMDAIRNLNALRNPVVVIW